MTNDILNILLKYCKLDDRRQIKYICPSDFMELANNLEKAFFLYSVINNEAVLQYQTCEKGKLTRCRCKSDQDCKKKSEVAFYCVDSNKSKERVKCCENQCTGCWKMETM